MTTQNVNLEQLSAAGVSVWLDDLSRDLIQSKRLNELIDTRSVVGVTTNPAIFQAAISSSDQYDDQIKKLGSEKLGVDEAIRTITTDDVRNACDVFAPIYKKSGGKDGRVSIEVDPRLAHETKKTIEQAKELWKIVDRPNALIKIPATVEGLEAITKVIGEGISVNVTLIFSVERYKHVIKAYLDGIELAKKNGHDISKIYSVASFFVSRVDTEIDNRLEKIGTVEAKKLLGKAGLANARLAYAEYENVFNSKDFSSLGANVQRPLWASTGVKNPNYPDTLYVGELVAPETVNTMPSKTMEAFADHGKVNKESIVGLAKSSQDIFDQLTSAGIDLKDVFQVLEDEGVKKFDDAWKELLDATSLELNK